MRILFAAIILLLTLILTGGAHANCYWEFSGRLEGYRPPNALSSARTWPLENVEMRVQARWSSGGFWNGPNWPTTRTGTNGAWSVRSAIAFADPDCQQDRDVRVQIRGFYTGNNWRTVHQQTISGPNGMTGLLNPIPTHTALVGNLILGPGNESENGVIHVENFGEPPVEWSTPGDDDGDNREPTFEDDTDPTSGDSHPNTPGGGSTPVATEDPCAIRRSPFATGVEFRFGQMPASPGPVSPDSALRVEQRPNGAGDTTLNRLTAHILVENAGSRDYNDTYRCPSWAEVRVKENPVQRDGDGWSNPWRQRIPDVAANTTEPMAINFNMLGAGDVFVGEWEAEFEHVLVEVKLDANNMVQENAEGDNVTLHCYHIPQNAFVGMSACQTSR